LAGKDELIILSSQGENCLHLPKFQPPPSCQDCCIAYVGLADSLLLVKQFFSTYPVFPLFFDSNEKEEATRVVEPLSGIRFPWLKVIGSLNHEVKQNK
jgi:hypothetical protein